jgi:hypothetical protein
MRRARRPAQHEPQRGLTGLRDAGHRRRCSTPANRISFDEAVEAQRTLVAGGESKVAAVALNPGERLLEQHYVRTAQGRFECRAAQEHMDRDIQSRFFVDRVPAPPSDRRVLRLASCDCGRIGAEQAQRGHHEQQTSCEMDSSTSIRLERRQ